MPHVRICAGGEQQCSSLPRPEPGGPTRTACAKSETGPRTPESQILRTYFPHHFNYLPLQAPASLPTGSYTGGEERLAVIRNPNRRTTTQTTGDQPVRLTQPPCTAARPPRSKESSQFSAKPRQILPNLAKFHQIGRPAARQRPTAGISGVLRRGLRTHPVSAAQTSPPSGALPSGALPSGAVRGLHRRGTMKKADCTKRRPPM